MREIKFRAWDKDRHRYAELREVRPVLEVEGGIITLYQGEQSAYIFEQFTGLRDKNGKEIWEGDIVRFNITSGFDAEERYKDNKTHTYSITKEVKFINGEFYPRECGEFPDDGFYAWRYWGFEVLGNIHENPELLK